MQVAYVETTCHCDEEGFEAFAWDHVNRALRPAHAHEEPILRLRCSACGGTHRTSVAVALTHEPVEPLTDDEFDELVAELHRVRDEIAQEEVTRPYVWPSLMQLCDDLQVVAELADLEEQITMLEHTGVLVMPGLLKRREELRAIARGLLPAAA